MSVRVVITAEKRSYFCAERLKVGIRGVKAMSGKCRPSLRKKTLVNLDRASRSGYISMTDYNCVKVAFE